jgi:hypothetical protein
MPENSTVIVIKSWITLWENDDKYICKNHSVGMCVNPILVIHSHVDEPPFTHIISTSVSGKTYPVSYYFPECGYVNERL